MDAFCSACQSYAGCAGANLCLLRHARELKALKEALAGHICGCGAEDCVRVTALLADSTLQMGNV